MKPYIHIGIGIATACMLQIAEARCSQDQYGNQYTYTLDRTTQSITGTVLNVQNCSVQVWPLIGSYARQAGVRVQQLTAANPDPNSSCVAMYMLKGDYPNFAWFYESGYGAQEATFVACSAIPTPAEQVPHETTKGRGALR